YLPMAAHEKVRRVMEDLSTVAPRAEVHLGVLEGAEVAYVKKPSGSRPVSMFYEARTVPAHACAMGKALLAFAPPELAALVVAARVLSRELATDHVSGRLIASCRAAV